MAVNHGSRRVMEKIGMRHARTVAIDTVTFPGTEHGDVWYELLRADWNGAAQAL
jgi:RimJ/RimL family protein N-acetyltransferase